MLIKCFKDLCQLVVEGDSETQELMSCNNVLHTDIFVLQIAENSISDYCDGLNCWKLEGELINDLCILTNQINTISEVKKTEQLLNIEQQISDLNELTANIVKKAEIDAITYSIFLVCFTAIITGSLVFQSAQLFESLIFRVIPKYIILRRWWLRLQSSKKSGK